MTKNELLATLQSELGRQGMSRIDDINANSRKQDIENAIRCLQMPDESMDDYIVVFRLKYPHTAKTIVSGSRDWKRHSFNRYHVFCTVRALLNIKDDD